MKVFRGKKCFNTQFAHIIGQNRWTYPGILDRDANINTRVAEVSRQKYKEKRADLAVVAQKVFKFYLSETFWNSPNRTFRLLTRPPATQTSFLKDEYSAFYFYTSSAFSIRSRKIGSSDPRSIRAFFNFNHL